MNIVGFGKEGKKKLNETNGRALMRFINCMAKWDSSGQ